MHTVLKLNFHTIWRLSDPGWPFSHVGGGRCKRTVRKSLSKIIFNKYLISYLKVIQRLIYIFQFACKCNKCPCSLFGSLQLFPISFWKKKLHYFSHFRINKMWHFDLFKQHFLVNHWYTLWPKREIICSTGPCFITFAAVFLFIISVDRYTTLVQRYLKKNLLNYRQVSNIRRTLVAN